MIQATLPQSRLDHLATSGQPHLRPIYHAMRGGRVAFLLVRQGKDRFRAPDGLPFVALVGDDLDRSLGPSGFHAKSLRRLAARARGIALISCEIVPSVYATAAACAELGQSALLVETRPEHEAAWMEMLRAAAPRAAFLLCTHVEGTA